MLKIIELAEMIDYIEDFFYYNNMSKSIHVGGMVGTPIMDYALNSASSWYTMDKILIVDGCQDAVLRKDVKEKLVNLKFWADIFMDNMTSKLNAFNQMGILNQGVAVPVNQYADWTMILNENAFLGYQCLIVNNAHLIPPKAIDILNTTFPGKMIFIVDPFEIGYESTGYIPTIVDSLNKLPKSVSFARSMFDVDTRYVNMKAKNPISKMDKIRLRSIGKLDSNQYVTDNIDIASLVWEKQMEVPFNKGHKLWVMSRNINNMTTSDYQHELISLPACAQLTITSVSKKHNLFKVQPHMSNIELPIEISYDDLSERKSTLYVRPANIIMLHDVKYHFYQNIVYIPSDNEHTSRRGVYTLLKHCNNVIVAENVK